MKKFFSLFVAALFAGSMMAETFTLVKDASTLADGDEIVILNEEGDYALSTSQQTNNRKAVAVTIGAETLVPGSDVQVIKLEKVASDVAVLWKMNVGSDAYLYAAASDKNYLRTATAADAGANGEWNISITDGVAMIVASGENTRNVLRFNPNTQNNSPLFSCYASSSSTGTLVKIYKKDDGGVTPPPSLEVDTPEILPMEEQFEESLTVRITHPNENAVIYYTLDGSNPSASSSIYGVGAAIILTQTTTVKAVAMVDNKWSEVVTKKYIKVESLTEKTCREVYSMAKDDHVALGNLIVTYVSGKNVWVKDNTGAMLLYLAANSSWVPGDELMGVQGVVSIYNDLYEVSMTVDQAEAVSVTSGVAPDPEELPDFDAEEDMNKYILLTDVLVSEEDFSFTTEGKNEQTTIFDGDVVLFNKFKFAYDFEGGATYNILGIVSIFKGQLQLNFIDATKVSGGSTDPEFLDLDKGYAYYMDDATSGTKWQFALEKEGADSPRVWIEVNPKSKDIITGNYSARDIIGLTVQVGDGPEVVYNHSDLSIECDGDGYYHFTIDFVDSKQDPYTIDVEMQLSIFDEAGAPLVLNDCGDEPGKPIYLDFDECTATYYPADADNNPQWSFNLRSSDASIIIQVKAGAADAIVGDYPSNGDIDLLNVELNGKDYTIIDESDFGDLVISCEGDGVYHFFMEFMYENQHYIIDTKVKVAAADCYQVVVLLNDCGGDPIDIKEYDIVADKGVIFDQMEDEDGVWWAVEAETDDFYIFLMNGEPGERLEGFYPIEKLDLDECVVALADPETGDFSEDIKFIGGGISIRVDETNEIIYVIGTLMDEDNNTYHINLTYTDPVAEEEQEIVDNEGELKDQTQEEGSFTIFGADNKDNIINITINSDQLEGVFTEADIDYSGSYVFTLSDGIQIIFTANIEVVRNADGSYTITADILCYNNVLYRVRINVPSDVEGFENLNAKEQLKKALENGQVVIIKNGAKYSVTGARL